jgi:hypothetical protein
MNRFATVTLAATFIVGATGLAQADDVVEKSFFPYKTGVPSHPFVKAGVTINASNVDQAKDVLDPALYQQIKDGWYEFKVGPTTSYDLHPTYIAATDKNYKTVQLGAKTGQLTGYVAGRPFPQEPTTADPRAGEKLAWNFQYGINYGDSGTISPFYWSYRTMADGNLERRLTMHFHFMNYVHRTAQEPIPEILPNPSELFRGIYVKVSAPQDVADTQLLIHRYVDDTKLDSTWLYLGFQRRVRKLSTGQTTDSFLGSDVMIEDFEGYNGRISDQKWTYKGTKTLLMPYYDHDAIEPSTELTDPEGFKFVDSTGKGRCYPKITWQLRKVHEVEAVPVDSNHPVGKRTFFFDGQIFGATRVLIYDRVGNMWKTFLIAKSRPEHHREVTKNAGVGIDGFFAVMDLLANHCTTGQFKSHVDPTLNPPSLFQVDHMRSGN